MSNQFKTLSLFWEQPCPHFGDELRGACTVFGYGLYQFWGRFGRFTASSCPYFGDILNNHTPSEQTCLSNTPRVGAKQAGRPVDLKYRTDGQPAWLRLLVSLFMVPMPPNQSVGVTGGSTDLLSLPTSEKKSGEKSW
jgi:hypothetical protein